MTAENASKSLRHVVLGALAYLLGTFPLAAVWHAVLLRDRYEAFGYLEGEPNFVLGFATIAIQGVVLSALFPRVRFAGSPRARALKYCAALGAFFWTSHVLAFVAKQEVEGALGFVLLETLYLVLQFGLFGLLLGWIHSGDAGDAG